VNEDQWLGRLKDEQLTDLAVQALVEMRLDEYRADLRAQVKAMSSWAIGKNRDGHTALWVNKNDILRLIDAPSPIVRSRDDDDQG
jgi:hypothetical protein